MNCFSRGLKNLYSILPNDQEDLESYEILSFESQLSITGKNKADAIEGY
jgi:hypothetical protein